MCCRCETVTMLFSWCLRDPLVDVQINQSLGLPGLASLPEGQPGIRTVGRTQRSKDQSQNQEPSPYEGTAGPR